MNIWRRLDLRSIDGHPREGTLAALCLTDRKTGKIEYRIGCFNRKGARAELWWEDCQGLHAPANLRKQNNIWWSSVERCATGGDV